MKSGNLNFLESSGPLQACNGTAAALQGQLYLYVGEDGARPSKNLEAFCSGEDFAMMTVITPLPPELNAQCNV